MKTYHLKAKIDFVDAERHEAILQIVRQAAQMILGSALMIQDKRPPNVTLEVHDMMNGTEVISLTGE